jgi:hypothetical protein
MAGFILGLIVGALLASSAAASPATVAQGGGVNERLGGELVHARVWLLTEVSTHGLNWNLGVLLFQPHEKCEERVLGTVELVDQI